MAYQFVNHAPKAIRSMGIEGTRAWLLHAMHIYDKEGLYPGSAALDKMEEFAREFRMQHISVQLEDVRNVLETFITGLAGRTLKLEAGNSIYTDTDTLYLPAQINRFNDREKNYQLYKATAVNLWAQTWFGTFKREHPDAPHLVQSIAEFDDHNRALKLFNLLETIRLNACIERELPGLAREMLTLDTPTPVQDLTWQSVIEKLKRAESTVADTLDATRSLYKLQFPWPDPLLYQGGFDLDAAITVIEQRLAEEKSALQMALQDLLQEQDGLLAESEDDQQAEFQLELGDDFEFELSLDGNTVEPSQEVADLLESLLQDLDSLPEDWLQPISEDEYNARKQPDHSDDLRKTGVEEGTFVYDEWDYRRQTYRKGWCLLKEHNTHPLYDDFVENTLDKYLHLVADIRRHFEALRGEDKTLKAQSIGDNIDLDALITAYADMHTGVEMSDRLFTQLKKIDRDLAVVFMVDVSGSTKGWINDAERESLVLLCEALEILGDQYAIYGFSGMTRNRCEVYKIKTFSEPYGREVKARISGLRPQDYTRMGVTIRHLSKLLNEVEARTRILITLSDGKPDDYDGYRGDYGIEDTRQALMEARHNGIHPFCITIDKEAGDYLPHMYGHASYVVVDEVKKLPEKVAEIYRKLTT